MRRYAFLIGMAALPAIAPAQAAVLFDTINGTTQSAQTPSQIVPPGSYTGPAVPVTKVGGPLAVSFSVPYTTEITSVTLRLFDPTPNDGGSVMVYLVEDNGINNMPSFTGSGLGLTFTDGVLIGSVSDNALAAIVDKTFSTNLHVTPGTYWIGVVNTPANSETITSAAWLFENSFTNGLNATGQRNFGQTRTTVTGNPPVGPMSYATTIHPTNLLYVDGLYMATITDAPEPATLAILGASLVGLGLARKRKGVSAPKL